MALGLATAAGERAPRSRRMWGQQGVSAAREAIRIAILHWIFKSLDRSTLQVCLIAFVSAESLKTNDSMANCQVRWYPPGHCLCARRAAWPNVVVPKSMRAIRFVLFPFLFFKKKMGTVVRRVLYANRIIIIIIIIKIVIMILEERWSNK